jgi:LPXTG-motif cell wall-anchored protein
MLAALWFVPSANASQDASQESSSTMTDSSAVARTSTDTATTTEHTAAEHTAAQAADTASKTTGGTATQTLQGPAGTRLADTGSIDTTPYVVGGTLLLGLGAGFVAYSVRRERTAAY